MVDPMFLDCGDGERAKKTPAGEPTRADVV